MSYLRYLCLFAYNGVQHILIVRIEKIHICVPVTTPYAVVFFMFNELK